MTGAIWAAVAGTGFGVFQTLNRKAIGGMDIYRSTFIQLTLSMVVLTAASALTEDLGRLGTAPAGSLVNFGLAGLIHFFVGWTLLNASQKAIGAARTSALIGTTPLFGAVLAAITLAEFPSPPALAGITVTMVGVFLVSMARVRTVQSVASEGGAMAPASLRGPLLGLGTALCWSVSPIFIRAGLRGLPSPLLGVTVSMVVCVAAYGVALALVASRGRERPEVSREALGYKLAAGFLVGVSTWARWEALDLAPVAVVLALGLLSIPVVILLAPVVVGRHLEHVNVKVVAGSSLIVGGSLALILYG